jgi:uncharacterized protein Yka (UPF0111/DUF47 family)
MRLGFGPGGSEVHEQLAAVGGSVLAVTRTVEQRFLRWPTGPSQEDVKRLEHETDQLVSRLLSTTNTMFVTPYDRDDLVTLAYALDDVADAADNASELLGLYGVETATRQSFELCALLVRAGEHLSSLVAHLRDPATASAEIEAIKAIEDEADDVARAARASLFRDDRIDPVIVIRWKDIYEALEEAVDACDTAASRAGNILVKNA